MESMVKKVLVGLYDTDTGECLAKTTRELPLDETLPVGKSPSKKTSPMRQFLHVWIDSALRGVAQGKPLSICFDFSEPEYKYIVGKIPF